MNRWLIIMMVLTGIGVAGEPVPAGDADTTSVIPEAYPVARYEAGWNKNPFTLKTAPAPVQGKSFAQDLALAGISGDTANPTVTIVNVKTHERIRLRKDRPADNGMVLAEVTKGATRKDSVVQLSLGSETSEVHYDSNYLKQMAATATPAAAVPAVGGGKIPIPQIRPGTAQQPPVNTPNTARPATAANRLIPPSYSAPKPPGMATGRPMAPVVAGSYTAANVPADADVSASAPTVADTNSTAVITIDRNNLTGNLTVTTGQSQTVASSNTAGFTGDSLTTAASTPLPERRRLITLPTNIGTPTP
ncbi:MAG: hypothetical protein R3F13_06360 [Prosthecobacter sp.]